MSKDMVIVGDVYHVTPDPALAIEPFETLVVGVTEEHIYYTFMDEFTRHVNPDTGEGYFPVYSMITKVWNRENHEFVKNIPLKHSQKFTAQR